MTYKVGTLFNTSPIDRLYLYSIRRIEKINFNFYNTISYSITYPFNNNSNILYRYYDFEINTQDILTEEEIKQLNKILTFQ